MQRLIGEAMSWPFGKKSLSWGCKSPKPKHTPMIKRNLLRAAAAAAATILTSLSLPLAAAAAEPVPPAQLPRLIDSGTFPTGHIQGITVDTEHRYIYYSYTTMLVKADMQGRIVGTVTGLMGHLGSLAFNAEDGRVYGSL